MSIYTVQPDKAEEFFSNPNLDPYSADRAAHDWLEEHRRLSQAKGLKKGMALAKQAMITPALQAHKRWSEKNHYNPTSSFRDIKQIKRQERTAKKLPRWEKLFSDEGFDEEIEARGLKGSYDRMIKLGADKEEVRNQYRRKLFVRDLAGKNNDVLQAKVAKGILGLQDSSDEAFLEGAKGWIGERARKRDHAKSGFDSGVASFLSKGSDFGADLSAQKEVSKEAGEAFSRAHRAMQEDYGHILPLVRGLVSEKETEGTRGLFESVDVPQVSIPKIIDLYENGEREKFLYMLGKVSELEGGEVEGGIAKFSKSISRGVGNIAGGIERKIDRLRNESNKDKISDDEYQREKHYLQFKRDISNLKAEVAKIDSDNMVVQGIYDAGQSVPYMAMMATGLGMGMAALSIQEQHMEEIISQDPSVDPDKALWVATVSAPIEVGIERLQFGVLRGKFPGIQKAVDKFTKGGLIRRVASVTAAEYTQETIQDAVLPTIQDIANDLGAEIPEGDWSNFKVMDARRFFAVLPLSILGGGGQYARDKFTASEVRSELVDPDKIRMSGGTIAEAKAIATLAKSNPEAALQEFKDVVLSKPVEERNKLGDEATDEIFSQDLKEGLEGLPVVLPQSDGGLKVKFGDGREEVASSPAEAQVLVDQHFQEDFVSNAEAVQDLIGGLSERVEGDNTVKQGRKRTFQEIAESGEQTVQSLKNAAAVYHAQIGEVAPDRIDLRNYSEQGSVSLRRKMAGFAVRIAKDGNTNPLTVAEEFSEGFVRMIVGQGETTFDEVKSLLDEFGDASGLKMTQGYDVDPERAVIEGFSKFAKAYMLQGKYDALPESVQSWSAKAWRIMENPESLPAPLRAAVEFFTKLLRSVYDVAKAIEFHKKDGAGIDPELEGLAMRALGLDEKRYSERMEEQYRKELLDDVFSPSEELSQRVKGRLPHPDDMKDDPLHGELKEIWGSMRKETRRKRKDGSRVMSDAKARNFFAEKGQGEDLDDLRQSLNEEGFRFTTPAEMLGEIQESVEGEKVWPVGQEEVAGYDTFSISPTSDATSEAIDRLFAGPSGLVDTGKKLRAKLAKVREKFEANMFGEQFQDKDTRSLETLNALMQLNAIASVLPKEVRHVVGSPVSLVSLKTEKARERNVIRRLDKIASALDKHLQKKMREEIRKELNKSGFKVSDSRRRKGKIGKIGHEVVDQIKRVMTMDLESSEAEKARITKQFDELEKPKGEDFERWDSTSLATDLFYDYENATTSRLEQALDFVTTNYKEGRKEWLTTLKARKEERDQWVSEAISFMGDKERVHIEDLTKADNKAKGVRNKVSEGAAEWIFSNHHTLARIVENAKDKKAARAWYNRLLDSRIQGDIKADRESDEKQQAFFDKVAEIIKAKGATQGHKVRKWLYEAKKSRRNRVTTIEGESVKDVSVDKHIVESILNEEVSGNPGDPFSQADREALSKQWEKFEDLTEKEQNKVRKIKFKRVVAMGERLPVGEISHAEALQWWLTMRQPDQREKLESMGWDSRTMEELEEFIPDDVKALGVWMSNDLVADGKTLSDVHADEFGIGLNTGENYFPVRNRVVDQPAEMDMNDPGAGRTISPGSLKERVSNRARPALANAFGTYFQHVTEMAYWKHNVGWVRQYGGAMRTKAFAENMEAKVGKTALGTLQKYLGAVQNRGVNAGRQMLAFERLVKSMLSRISLSVLGARVSTMWVNATAFVNALGSSDVSATTIMKNMLKMGLDSKGELKATWRNELATMRRRYGASFEAQLAMKSGNSGHWLIQDAEKLAQKGLIPMNTIDVATNTLTMAAIYRAHFDSAIKRKASEEDARFEADRAVTRAQAVLAQPTLSVSRSLAEMATSQNPFVGIFTMFMSEVRKNAANNYVAWRTLLTGKGLVDRATAGRQAAVYTLVYTGVVQAFRGLYNALTGDDEKDEEIEEQLRDPKFWTYAVASDNLAPVPLFGDAALSMMAGPLDQKYWDQKTPFTRIVSQWRQMDRIFNEKESDSAKIDEVIDQMQSWGSVLPGGPILAEAANLAEFGKKVAERGYGYSFSESDKVSKIRMEISQNKDSIYEENEDQETRWGLLQDVAEQYKEENPELWPKVRAELKEKKVLPKSILDAIN